MGWSGEGNEFSLDAGDSRSTHDLNRALEILDGLSDVLWVVHGLPVPPLVDPRVLDGAASSRRYDLTQGPGTRSSDTADPARGERSRRSVGRKVEGEEEEGYEGGLEGSAVARLGTRAGRSAGGMLGQAMLLLLCIGIHRCEQGMRGKKRTKLGRTRDYLRRLLRAAPS